MKAKEKTKMKNKICIYAICKNEEQFVDKWCESMKEADSIVVLDTGSTDNTVEKLRSHGVKVETKIIDPWRFDVARNESLKLVPEDCNILMSTDLDEILEPGWAKPLREKWIDGVHQRGIYKYTWSHLDNGGEGRVFHYDKIHTKDWIWKAPVHELLFNTKTNSHDCLPGESLNLFNEIHLHHYPDPNKSRGSYLPLLELRAKENPEDWYGLIYLAHEYFYRGKNVEAINLLKRIVKDYANHYNEVEHASCYLFMGDGYRSLALSETFVEESINYFEKAIRSYKAAINIEPTYIEPYLNLGKLYLDLKQYEDAVNIIKTGLLNSFRHYTWLERDTSWSYEPWDLLCLASYYGGKRKDALTYAQKALSFNPNDERLKSNVDLCLSNLSIIELLQ